MNVRSALLEGVRVTADRQALSRGNGVFSGRRVADRGGNPGKGGLAELLGEPSQEAGIVLPFLHQKF